MPDTLFEEPFADRLTALRAADVLFSDTDESFDVIARSAAQACGVPVALVNFLDDEKQWTKASCGVSGRREMPVEDALCAQTMRGTGLVESCDTLCDERFVANPFVAGEPHVRFYAGVPLLTTSGLVLGTLCVLDFEPRRLTEMQREDLRKLAALLSELIAMRIVVRQALQSKLRVLSEAFEHTDIPLLIIEIDPNEPEARMCTYVNSEFTAQFGHLPENIVGRRTLQVVAGRKTDPALATLLADPAGYAVPIEIEAIIYCANGDERLVLLQRRPVPAPDGSITSWVVSLRDRTLQRAAAVQLALQAERMHQLYAITSNRGMTGYDEVDSVLRLGLSTLGFDCAFVARVDGDDVTILNLVGDAPGMSVGQVVPLRATWLQEAMDANDVRTYADLSKIDAGAREKRDSNWGSYIVAPIGFGSKLYGGVGFLAVPGHVKTFADGDREFVRLIGSFIGSSFDRQLQKNKLDALAFSDALTGLDNRAKLFERLDVAVERSGHDRGRFAIHYIDLDGFKAVNDSASHVAGDAVLVEVAKRLRDNVRDRDVVARIGGDEFVVVQHDVSSQDEAERLAKRLIDAIGTPIVTPHGTFTVGASVGIAIHTAGIVTAHDLLNGADRALYRAKAHGKGKARLATDARRTDHAVPA